MRVRRQVRVLNVLRRVSIVGVATVLTGCQVVAPPARSEARLLVDRPADQPNAASAPLLAAPNSATVPAVTYTVKRSTFHETLTIPGRVVPARSAQLALRGSGTVTAVYVAPGKLVSEGQTLAEFALDDESLQAARTQATMADLAYQSQLARVQELRSGAAKSTVEALRASLERDRAEIQQLELQRDAARAANDRAGETREIAVATAERRVTLADMAVQAAQANQTDAQAELERITAEEEDARAKAYADAEIAAEQASVAVRGAERKAQEASVNLEQMQLLWSSTKASQELATRELRLQQARDVLREATVAERAAREQAPSSDHNARQIQAEIAAAIAAVRGAERAVAAAQLDFDQAGHNLPAARSSDDAQVKRAALTLEQANDDLAQLKIAAQRAQQNVSALAPSRSARQRAGDSADAEKARSSVRQAENQARIDKINLEEARAALTAVGKESPDKTIFADRSLDAARAQLAADEARLAELESGTSAAAIAREETRAGILRDQADAAAAAAQPVVILRAPFDGMVTEVGVSQGQTIAPRAAPAIEGVVTAAGAATGQASEGRTSAIRIAGAGVNSIIADASESDVSLLAVNQSVPVAFPGLSGETVPGKIVEIGAAAVIKGETVTYPVRIDVTEVPPTLKLGMTAQVNVPLKEAKDILVVPREALRGPEGQKVASRIGPDGRIQEAQVQTGHTYGTEVELLGGLDEGDVVAVYPAASAR
jgi:HlyD family secretion protein